MSAPELFKTVNARVDAIDAELRKLQATGDAGDEHDARRAALAAERKSLTGE